MSDQETQKQKKKRPRDLNRLASSIVQDATGEEEPLETQLERLMDEPQDLQAKVEKNPHAVELGRLGGLKGGRARAEKLTPEKRSKIAKKAARVRWSRQR